MIEELATFAKAQGWNLYDLAIIHGGKAESAYLQDCNKCNNSYSVAKAFTMTAIGMLRDEGRLDLDDRVAHILRDQIPPAHDRRWDRVTVHHALSHTTGLAEGLMDIDVDDVTEYGTRDYLHYVLRHSLPFEPGERYVYTDATYYILSRVVTALTGQTLAAFLTRRLFAPLGFTEMAWSSCPMGYTIGATGLYIKASDMVKLAWLYRGGGTWAGERLLSREWVDLVRARRYELAPTGLGDWQGKGGMYGQMMAFSPSLDLAIAWHGFQRKADFRPLLTFAGQLAGAS